MSKIPEKLLMDILADPYYDKCARQKDGGCEGRITFEHSLYYAGRQIQEKFAIIPLCARHHGVNEWMDRGLLDKEKNEQIAVNRMTKKDEHKYPNVDWKQKRAYLNGKYGCE